MGGVMGSFFFSKKNNDKSQVTPITSLRVQSAVEGVAIPMLWGQSRISGNMIWYGDFTAIAVQQQQGGKGGGGGGGKGQQGNVTYNYSVSMALALCEGPIKSVARAWVGTSDNGTAAGLGFELFTGEYTQAAWGYLTTKHPDQALNYRGIAYLAQAGLQLGTATEIQNYSFEVKGAISDAAPGIPDANAKDVLVDILTNVHYGVPGWPADRIGNLDQFSDYSMATGMLVSPALTDQNDAAQFLNVFFQALNCGPRWSSGKLDVVPWGDSPVTGNGVQFTPDVQPLYDLTNDDFQSNQGSLGSGNASGQPITAVRTPPEQRLNCVVLEYLDRVNDYNPTVTQDKDEASVQQYSLKSSDTRGAHFICLGAAARLSAHLQLIREQIAVVYSFTLDASFVLIDVEDIVTLTRPEMGLARQGVRITEIQENQDGTLTFTAEEFLGTSGAPKFGQQASSGYAPNMNADPGDINPPIIFEPSDQLGAVDSPTGGGLQVWAAVSGVDKALWGGCNVYASYDGVTFSYIDRVLGPARMGVLAADLPAFPVNPTGANIDQDHVLKVDLSMSGAALISGTTQDATLLNTACFVGGEIIAYRDAVLTSASAYSLSYLVRGAYGTDSSMALQSKLTGSPFARLDQGILKIPFDQSRIGSTIYLKFQSFNIYGGGLQDISTLPVHTYTITGSALASPLPIVQNLRLAYNDGFNRLWWDDIVDFRTGIRYKIFKGDTFVGAEQVDDVAHAPFNAFGNGTYWVVAYCQPVPALYVMSEEPASIGVIGAMLVSNLVHTSDQQAEGWPGIFSNGVAKDGVDPNAFIRLGGSGNILDDTDILNNPDVLNYGGIAAQGTYEVAPKDYIDVGYVADCSVEVTWKGVGVPVGSDILSIADFLNTPDILGSASTQYVTVKPQIALADTADFDFFNPPDFFDPPDRDVFTSGINWSDWQDYAPGTYRCRFVKLRLLLQTVDPQTIAYDLSFKFNVSVPARIDHYPNVTVPADGVMIRFIPDDAATAYSPFNGGPPVGGSQNQPLPMVQFNPVNAPGLTPVIDDLSLASLTFHFEDASGTHVAVANCGVQVEGY
jgi:hypothetical protein